MLKKTISLLMFSLVLVVSTGHAEVRLDLDATSIIGNRELPRIVYLIAWRDAPEGDILEQSLESNHDNRMIPLDRDVFQRQISYYELLFGDEKNKQ